MAQFGVVVGQLVGFFIMLLVGYGCVRLKFYGMTALNGMCALLLNVLIPVLVFANAVDGTTRGQLFSNVGVMLLIAIMYACSRPPRSSATPGSSAFRWSWRCSRRRGRSTWR